MTPKQIIKLLEENGFTQIRSIGSHRFFKNADTGKAAVVPFHGKDLKPATEINILKQAGLK
jgi:predicted RNA binding protein YcfA (HicA-like mRNA interferase family)